MKVSPPTLIGGILLLVAGTWFSPVNLEWYVAGRHETWGVSLLIELIRAISSPYFSTSWRVPDQWSCPISVDKIPFILLQVSFIICGLLGIIGGGTQRRGLKLASGIFALVGFAVAFPIMGALVAKANADAVACGYVDPRIMLEPDEGMWVALVAGTMCLVGLAVRPGAAEPGIAASPAPAPALYDGFQAPYYKPQKYIFFIVIGVYSACSGAFMAITCAVLRFWPQMLMGLALVGLGIGFFVLAGVRRKKNLQYKHSLPHPLGLFPGTATFGSAPAIDVKALELSFDGAQQEQPAVLFCPLCGHTLNPSVGNLCTTCMARVCKACGAATRGALAERCGNCGRAL